MCYRAGAYRSAVVNTWIAVVFDLVDKIRDLALAGDAEAQAINSQYETYLTQIEAGNDQGIRNALDFERTILQTCKNRLQFFNHQQLRDLERLREDRHQCAHPSFQRPGEPYHPSAENARVHIRMAVEHVLAQPPVQGRSAIAELVSVVSSDYFPRERNHAVAILSSSALAGATDALVRGFADALIFGFSDDSSPLHIRAQVCSAVSALLDLHRAVAEPRVARQLSKLVRDVNDDRFPSVAQLVAGVDDGPWLVDDAARVRLAEFLRIGPQADVIRAIAGLARHPEIEVTASARILPA